MKHVVTSCALLIVLVLYAGCSSSRELTAIPPGLDLSNVPKESFTVTAERFRFTPDEIHIRAGTLIHLDLKGVGGAHAFRVSDFGIDEPLDEGETKSIELYVGQKGEYAFRCSHFCGIGHFGMKGKIIAE
jgi:cytochrome c oxidase subunit II